MVCSNRKDGVNSESECRQAKLAGKPNRESLLFCGSVSSVNQLSISCIPANNLVAHVKCWPACLPNSTVAVSTWAQAGLTCRAIEQKHPNLPPRPIVCHQNIWKKVVITAPLPMTETKKNGYKIRRRYYSWFDQIGNQPSSCN